MLVVILKKLTEDTLEFRGNGFVTNKKGLLISAGHLFHNGLKNTDDYYAAIPSKEKLSKLYNIKMYYREHFDPLKAKTPEEIKRKNLPKYEDLFIGRVLNYKLKSHFKLQIKRPQKDEKLHSLCYLRNQSVSVFPIINGQVDLGSLNEESESNPIVSREFGIISNNENDFNINPDLVDHIKRYNNTMGIKFPSKPGSSGSPIFLGEKVIGINLKGYKNVRWKHILCSKYLRRQYRYICKS